MLRTRPHVAIMALAAGVLAISACTSDPEGDSTGTQEASSATASTVAPSSTEQQPSLAPAATTKPVSPASGTADAVGDVKLSALRVDTKGKRSAEVAIKNNSPKSSNYIIDLELVSADGKTQLDTAMISAVGLAAGKTTKVKAEFTSSQKVPDGAKINIVGVSRISG